MRKFMNKKTEAEYIDDGRTIADMSAEWMPWNRGLSRKKKRSEKREKNKESKEEQKQTYRAAVKGQYLAMLPVLLCILISFGIMYFLLQLWLS